MNLLRKLSVVVVALAGAGVTLADPIIVSSEADVLALVGDVTREGFESFPIRGSLEKVGFFLDVNVVCLVDFLQRV